MSTCHLGQSVNRKELLRRCLPVFWPLAKATRPKAGTVSEMMCIMNATHSTRIAAIERHKNAMSKVIVRKNGRWIEDTTFEKCECCKAILERVRC